MLNHSVTPSARASARPVSVLLVIGATFFAACQGGEKSPEATDTAAPQVTAAAPAGFDPSTITPAMIALGDSLFLQLQHLFGTQSLGVLR